MSLTLQPLPPDVVDDAVMAALDEDGAERLQGQGIAGNPQPSR